MKRRINKVGSNTLTVSLPNKWVKENGIKKGDEIEITEEGKNLILGSDPRSKTLGKKIVKIDSSNNFVKRMLFIPYTLGYDEIEVQYKEQTTIEKIESTVEIMTGFEIIEQKANYCLIQNIARGQETKFDDVLKRLVFLIHTMSDELKNGIKEGNGHLNSLPSMRRMANKFTIFCGRILHVNGHKNQDLTIRYYMIINLLERVAVYIRDLGEHINSKNKLCSKEEIEMINYLDKQIIEFTKLFFDKNRDSKMSEFKNNTRKFADNSKNSFTKKIDSKNFFVASRTFMALDVLDQIMQKSY